MPEKGENQQQGQPIGKISHYFDKIGVAVIELEGGLKNGDRIRIVGGQDTDFEQEVESIEVEHQQVQSAKKGEGVGLKVQEKVRPGYKVYRL